MKLTRDLYIPCLDTSSAKDLSSLVPVDLSTSFELSWNPQEETYSYICYKNDTTETESYQPELPLNIVLNSDNPMYTFLFALAKTFPTGADANVPCVICVPNSQGAVTEGWLWQDAVVSFDTLNTVDGQLSFSIKLNGDMTLGSVAITETGGRKTIAFTPTPSA